MAELTFSDNGKIVAFRINDLNVLRNSEVVKEYVGLAIKQLGEGNE